MWENYLYSITKSYMANNYFHYTNTVLKEIETVLYTADPKEIQAFIKAIKKANKIVVAGAGRVGMATRAFAMRLGHLNMRVHTLGDSTVPGIGKGDLLLVSSGSGETQTIFDIVKTANDNNANIVLVTGNPDSRMGRLADTIVQLKAPSKTKKVANFASIQPMTTLNEQSLFIFFDIVVLLLMDGLNETHDTMWERHSNLE